MYRITNSVLSVATLTLNKHIQIWFKNTYALPTYLKSKIVKKPKVLWEIRDGIIQSATNDRMTRS